MFNSNTKKILLLSLLALFVTSSFFASLIYLIHTKGAELEEKISLIEEKNAQETSFILLRRMVKDTENERSAIDSIFFKDESDSIQFLGEVEEMAQTIGLELTTTGLDKVQDQDQKTEHISMTFVYKGTADKVINFTKLLENSPYHSWAKDLSLRKNTNNLWEGQLTLFITIQPS